MLLPMWRSIALTDSLVGSGWAGAPKQSGLSDTQVGKKLIQLMILVTFMAWILLVILPLAFPKMKVIPADKLANVSLVLTTLIGIGVGPEVYQRMRNGHDK